MTVVMVSLPIPPDAWCGHPNQTSIASMDEDPMVDNKCSKPLLMSFTWQRSAAITTWYMDVHWWWFVGAMCKKQHFKYRAVSIWYPQWVRKTRQSLSILHVLKDMIHLLHFNGEICFGVGVFDPVWPLTMRALWMDPDICREIILDFQMVLHSTCNVEPQTLCKRLDLDKTYGPSPWVPSPWQFWEHIKVDSTSKASLANLTYKQIHVRKRSTIYFVSGLISPVLWWGPVRSPRPGSKSLLSICRLYPTLTCQG